MTGVETIFPRLKIVQTDLKETHLTWQITRIAFLLSIEVEQLQEDHTGHERIVTGLVWRLNQRWRSEVPSTFNIYSSVIGGSVAKMNVRFEEDRLIVEIRL